MVLSWTCLIFWSPLIKNWLFFLSILRYIFGSFFSDGSIISYSLGVKFGCLPTEFLLGWRVSLCVCVCVIIVHELHRNFWRCSIYWGKFISWWHFAPSIPHFPNVTTLNTVGCLPASRLVQLLPYFLIPTTCYSYICYDLVILASSTF